MRKLRSDIQELRSIGGSSGKEEQQKSGPSVPAKLPQMGELRPGRKLMAHRIAEQQFVYVMPAMNVLHEPIQVEQMMGCVKPCVENKHINENLLDGFEQRKLVFLACPVPIVRCERVHFPQPYYCIQNDEKQCTEAQSDLFFCIFPPQLVLGEGVRVLECRSHNKVCRIVSKSYEQESPTKLGETANRQHTDEGILNRSDVRNSVAFNQADNGLLDSLIRHLNFKIKRIITQIILLIGHLNAVGYQ